nr:uncharacterized protein LOC124811684 isoform X2 [Hydra vulgaris]
MTDSSEEVVEVVNVEENDKSNFDPNSEFERPGCSGEVESNTFERPGCSGEVESNTVQNFTVSCEGIIEVRKETEKQIKEIISLNQMDCLSKSKNLLCETSKIPESQLDLS